MLEEVVVLQPVLKALVDLAVAVVVEIVLVLITLVVVERVSGHHKAGVPVTTVVKAL
tara:strand:+ start:299 stop:469 length:171 start_codon:yes stop_codon:yes gene_type:complete